MDKSLWGRIFLRKKHETDELQISVEENENSEVSNEMEITSTIEEPLIDEEQMQLKIQREFEENIRALSKSLKNEFGINVFRIESNGLQLDSKRYHKLNLETAAQAGMFFQFVPQIATGLMNNDAVKQQFMKATKDTYHVLLDPNTYMPASKKVNGGLAPVALDVNTNQAGVGSPVLMKNDVEQQLPSGPSIALGIFNVISMITGQYFMSQINAKLADVKTGIENVMQFLEVAQRSELKAALQAVETIIMHLGFISKHPERIQSELTQLKEVQLIAQKNINFSQEWLNNELAKLNKNDKSDIITKHLETVGQYLLQYKTAYQLYAISVLIEIQMQSIMDTEELQLYYNMLQQQEETYKAIFNQCQSALKSYLELNHVLNDANFWQHVASVGTSVAVIALGNWILIPMGFKLGNKVNQLFVDARNKQKTEKEEQMGRYFAQISDNQQIEAPRLAIQRMIDAFDMPIEFCMVGDDVYTNLLPAND